MTGHTPGPWERRAPPVFDSGNPWAVVAPDGQVLAIVRYGELGNLLPAEANARLIAAAPEMYEALSLISQDERSSAWARLHARAAIARAEGPQP